MSRETVNREMEERFGRVLPFFDRIPDEFVDAEWDLMKRVQFGETLIPNRYKELIGLAVAATTRCSFGTALHSELARLHGATDAELEETLHYTKLVSGWALFMNGLQIDQGRLEEDLVQAVAFADGRGVPKPTTEEDTMMSTQTDPNKEIVRRYQDAYNSGNLDVLDELLAPDWATNAFPTAVLEQTIENAKEVHRMLLEAFPDLHYTTEALIAEGDSVVQLWTARATHKGEALGLAPTGNPVEFGGISIFDLADGKIVRHIAFNDVIDVVHQCGGEVPADWLAFVHRPS